MADKGPRTQMLVRMKAPETSISRVAFLGSCLLMILFGGAFTTLCTGFEILFRLTDAPVVAIVAAFTSLLLGVPYYFVIRWLDRNEPEPIPLALSAVAWGAVMATGFSGLFNSSVQGGTEAMTGNAAFASQFAASISAPFVEELTKGLALVALYLFFNKHFDNVLDGIIYGALIGLGFATYENWAYYCDTGSVAGVLVLTVVRGFITSLGTHTAFTAMTGAGLGMFRVLRTGFFRWLIPPLALGFAMFAHFCWNTLQLLFLGGEDASLLMLPVAVIVLQTPFVLMVLTVSMISLVHEGRIIREYLSTEKPPVVMAGEIARLVPARNRTMYMAYLLVTFQFSAWWLASQRNHRLIRLAFEKWHMDQEIEHESMQEGREHAVRVTALRDELRKLVPAEVAPKRN